MKLKDLTAGHLISDPLPLSEKVCQRMREPFIFALLVLVTSSMVFGKQANQRGVNQAIRKFNLKDFSHQEAVRTLRQDWAEAVKFIEQDGEAGGKDDWVQAKNMQTFEAKPTYGDLTSDGSEEAAVSVSYELGGTSSFSAVFVYTMTNGKPRLLARLKGGDRAHGAIESVKILNGRLSVGRYKPTADDCNACYGFIETTRYEWRATGFVKVGAATRPFEPSQRGRRFARTPVEFRLFFCGITA